MGRTFLTAAMLVIAPLSGLGCTKHIPQAPKLTTTSPTASSADAGRETEPSAPFAGAWESCAGAESPEECSRYLLLQRGKLKEADLGRARKLQEQDGGALWVDLGGGPSFFAFWVNHDVFYLYDTVPVTEADWGLPYVYVRCSDQP